MGGMGVRYVIARWCEMEGCGLPDYKKRSRHVALTSYNPQPRR